MSRTSRSSSIFSSALGLFQGKPRKVSKAATRTNGSKVLAKSPKRNGRARANPYQSAEIVFDGDCACQAVRAVEGKRFLVGEVPPIPMPDCDSPNCNCAYERFKDRRSWFDDRRALFNRGAEIYVNGETDERRKGKDRRVSEESQSRDPGSVDEFETWLK